MWTANCKSLRTCLRGWIASKTTSTTHRTPWPMWKRNSLLMTSWDPKISETLTNSRYVSLFLFFFIFYWLHCHPYTIKGMPRIEPGRYSSYHPIMGMDRSVCLGQFSRTNTTNHTILNNSWCFQRQQPNSIKHWFQSMIMNCSNQEDVIQ